MAARKDYANSVQCVIFIAKDESGKKMKMKQIINADKIDGIILDYNVIWIGNGNDINNVISNDTYLKRKEGLGFSKLGNLYLMKKISLTSLRTSPLTLWARAHCQS